MSYFTTLDFRFTVNKNLIFNYFSGYYARGIFYSTLRKVDPALAEQIHNSRSLSPFSSTALMIEHENHRFIVFNRVDKPCFSTFGYSIFLPEIAKKIMESVLQEGTISLLDQKISLNAAEIREWKWGDFINFSKPVKKFDLVFMSPTYFRLPPTLVERYDAKSKLLSKKEKSPYRYYPLPDPSLLVRSISKLWRMFSPIKLDLTGLISWIGAGGLVVSGFPKGIRTYKLYEHEKADKWIVGFTGKVCFSIPNDLFNKDSARNLDALLRFSEFSNVGGGRTAGLGMVKYIPIEYEEPSEM